MRYGRFVSAFRKNRQIVKVFKQFLEIVYRKNHRRPLADIIRDLLDMQLRRVSHRHLFLVNVLIGTNNEHSVTLRTHSKTRTVVKRYLQNFDAV